jgi:hypothetical protein
MDDRFTPDGKIIPYPIDHQTAAANPSYWQLTPPERWRSAQSCALIRMWIEEGVLEEVRPGVYRPPQGTSQTR